MGWIRESSLLRKFLPVVLPALSISLAAAGAANAQCVKQSITNGTITATVGISGTPSGVTPAINCAGRFGVVEAGGATPGTLMYDAVAAVKQSYVTVRIDGGPPTVGADAANQTAPGWDLIFGDVGTNALNATNASAKTDQGGWLVPPSIQGNALVATWTTLPGGNATFPIPRIEISLKLTLVHDMVSYQFTVTNKDTAAHTVALRFAQDFNVPGTTDGPVITPNLGQISTDTDLVGATVPTFWRARNTATDQSVGATLRSSTGSSATITAPSRLTFGAPISANLPLWDFTRNLTDNFSIAPGDAGSGVYFNTDNYAPSASRTLTTYFGKQTSTINFDAPWAAGVTGPFALQYDPTKPAGQQLTPNPFTVSAFVLNLSQLTLTNVTAVLSLPPGLTLASGETATKSTASLDVGAETSFSWQVVPDGTQSGRLTYSVAISAGPGAQGKVITRDIDIPSLPTQSFTAGIQMVSFPYSFADPTPDKALGLNIGTFDLLRWNPTVSVYEAVSQIRPGEGYWLRLPTNTTLNLVGATPLATSSTKFEVKLLKDWNQIGNPFLFRVRWADITVVTTDVGDPNYLVPLTVAQAAQSGLIAPTIYFYDTSNGAYRFDQDFSTELVPFQGYWVKALKSNVSLLIPPSTGRSASVKSDVVTRAVSTNGWLLRIEASTGKSRDNWNFIGVSSGASDGYDLKDFEKPPFVQDAVRLQFTRDGWGTRAGVYAQDIQAANGGKKTWNMNVVTPGPNQDVTLMWPEVSTLPRSYELFITDMATGQRRQMRQTTSIRVNTGNASSRAFTITAEPRAGAGVFSLSMQSRPVGRGAGVMTFDVSSTQDATITLRIKGASGQTVRTLTGRSASLGSTATYLWDGRDLKGTSVAAGSYMVEVTGTSSDGETRRIAQPVIVVR